MKWIAALLAAAALSGCSSISDMNRANRTTFEPMPDGSFRMTASDSPQNILRVSDHYREWAASYVRENRICSSGFDVIEMQKILVGKDPVFKDETHRHHYIIRCKQ